MAVEIERLRIVIEGDDGGIKKIDASVDDARKGFRRLGDDAKKVLADIRTSAAAASAEIARSLHENVTRPMLDAAKGWLEAGSDMQEQLSKVNTLLGQSGKEVDAWSKQTAAALGVSRREALTFAGTFAGIFTPMGFNQQTTAKMSKTLVQLAADMASFSNTSVDDALQALQSGINGESEPLRRFGVNITELTVKQEALKLGLIKTLKEGLSPAQKAAASYSLILKQTSIAQGDVARTAGGLANQQRMLKAEVADLTAEIGARLVPVALSVVHAGREWLAVWGAIPAPLQNVALAVVAVVAGIGPLVLGFKQLAFVAAEVKAVFAGIGPLVSGVAAAIGLSLGELLAIVASVVLAVGALYLAWRENFGGLRDLTDAVVKAVQPYLDGLAQWFAQTLPTALAAASVGIKLALQGWQYIGQSLGTAWKDLRQFAGLFVAWVKSQIEAARVFAHGVGEAFSFLWGYILDTTPLGSLLKMFQGTFSAIKEVVMDSIQSIVSTLSTFFGTLAKASGADKWLKEMRGALLGIELGLGIALDVERKKVVKGLDSIKGTFAGFKLPALPKLPGLATGLDFKGMNLEGLPEDGSKKDSAAKKHADDIKRRMEQLTEELMRLTLDRYQFERWQAKQRYDEDIQLGIDRVRAQEIYSAQLRKINQEEGAAHQKAIEGWLEAEQDAHSKQLKGAEKVKSALEKAWKGYNDWVAKANKETADAFVREQRDAAEAVAKGLEATAATSGRISEAMKDLAGQFDTVGGRASYFEDTLAKLNLQNEALTQQQRDAVQTYANAWQELDRIQERQKLVQQTAGELQGVFKSAFTSGLRDARTFFREIERGLKEAVLRQIADIAASASVKWLMGAFGMKQNGLAESARSARNDILIASAALSLSATALKEAAKDARKAGETKALVAGAGAAFGPIGAGVAALFSGFFAEGGHVPAGQWGIAGENGPEPIFGGKTGVDVLPNSSMRSQPTPQGEGMGDVSVNLTVHGGINNMGGVDQLSRVVTRSVRSGLRVRRGRTA
jgi:hypothetical protein